MKNNPRPNFYFSAYPLKALNLPEEKKPYLHIYKREIKSNRPAVHSKVLPMSLASYEKAVKEFNEAIQKQPDNIDQRETEWFASYE